MLTVCAEAVAGSRSASARAQAESNRFHRGALLSRGWWPGGREHEPDQQRRSRINEMRSELPDAYARRKCFRRRRLKVGRRGAAQSPGPDSYHRLPLHGAPGPRRADHRRQAHRRGRRHGAGARAAPTSRSSTGRSRAEAEETAADGARARPARGRAAGATCASRTPASASSTRRSTRSAGSTSSSTWRRSTARRRSTT